LPTQNQEEVKGYIVSFMPFTNNYKIFLLRSIDGREFWCQGTINPSKTPYENDKVYLAGSWRINSHHPEYGKQFYFTSYEIIAPGKPEKVIRRPRTGDAQIASTAVGDTVGEQVAAHLKAIGALKMTYQFNKPIHNTISQHVLKQLNDRVILAAAEKKDFYFLTALLDRKVSDTKVQLFRRSNQDFKTRLLQCWNDAYYELNEVISDIRHALSDGRLLKTVFTKSKAFQYLKENIPGPHGFDQLLVCLKVMRDKYNMDATVKISDLLSGATYEKVLKQYLINIPGVKHKIANWALTNITGHWFVIDEPNIKPMIKKDLADKIPSHLAIESANADAIFEYWFGKLDEMKREYDRFSQEKFVDAFPDFPPTACEYLPFIATQYLWFYGKKINMAKSRPKAIWAVAKEYEFVVPVIPKSNINGSIFNPCNIDWQKIQSIEDLITALPADIKPKTLWKIVPERLKEEIVTKARYLSEARSFAAPAEWDGSLKQALLLMANERLPNGFKYWILKITAGH